MLFTKMPIQHIPFVCVCMYVCVCMCVCVCVCVCVVCVLCVRMCVVCVCVYGNEAKTTQQAAVYRRLCTRLCIYTLCWWFLLCIAVVTKNTLTSFITHFTSLHTNSC